MVYTAPPAEAKSYCSPCCPSQAFPGGGARLGQGWVGDLECGPRGDPSPPHRPPQDLQSEPFWRMNKYFTQHQVAVPGLRRLVCPSPGLYETPPRQDAL